MQEGSSFFLSGFAEGMSLSVGRGGVFDSGTLQRSTGVLCVSISETKFTEMGEKLF